MSGSVVDEYNRGRQGMPSELPEANGAIRGQGSVDSGSGFSISGLELTQPGTDGGPRPSASKADEVQKKEAQFLADLRDAGLKLERTLSPPGVNAQGAVYQVQNKSGAMLACKWLCSESAESDYYKEYRHSRGHGGAGADPGQPQTTQELQQEKRRLREMRANRMLAFAGDGAGTYRENLMQVLALGSLGVEEYLLLELCGGTLADSLDYEPPTGRAPISPPSEIVRRLAELTAAQALHMCQQLFRGLAVMHACDLCHNDIHPGNVFVTARPTSDLVDIKLGDFGLAEPLGFPFDRHVASLPGYMKAPEHDERVEAFKRDSSQQYYSKPQDVWAAGACLLLALLPRSLRAKLGCAGRAWRMYDVPFTLTSLPTAHPDIAEYLRSHYGPTMADILACTVFASDPSNRATAGAVLALLDPSCTLSLPKGPAESPLDALVLAAMAIANTRRRAKSKRAERFKWVADQCVRDYPPAAFRPATFFQWNLNAALFLLPLLQDYVSQMAARQGVCDDATMATYRQPILEYLVTAERLATGQEKCQISNSKALLNFEFVKASALSGNAIACVQHSDSIIADLNASLAVVRDNGWHFVGFQHARNVGLAFVESYELRKQLAISPETQAQLAAAAASAMRVMEEGFEFRDRARSEASVDSSWRDKWALALEICRLLALQGKYAESLRRNRLSLEQEATVQNNAMMVARARHLALKTLLQWREHTLQLGVAPCAQCGSIQDAEICIEGHDSVASCSLASAHGQHNVISLMALADSIVSYYNPKQADSNPKEIKTNLSKDTYGITNALQHCSAVLALGSLIRRDGGLGPLYDSLQQRATAVLAIAQQLRAGPVPMLS